MGEGLFTQGGFTAYIVRVDFIFVGFHELSTVLEYLWEAYFLRNVAIAGFLFSSLKNYIRIFQFIRNFIYLIFTCLDWCSDND